MRVVILLFTDVIFDLPPHIHTLSLCLFAASVFLISQGSCFLISANRHPLSFCSAVVHKTFIIMPPLLTLRPSPPPPSLFDVLSYLCLLPLPPRVHSHSQLCVSPYCLLRNCNCSVSVSPFVPFSTTTAVRLLVMHPYAGAYSRLLVP